jgi:hypothetical protein
MAVIRSGEAPFWRSIPLAVVLWGVILWGFGFFLVPPRIDLAPPAPAQPIDARFVELPDSRPSPPRAAPAPKARPVRPRPRVVVPVRIPPHPRVVEPAPPIVPAPPPPPVRLTPPSPDNAPTDMMSYVNAARARRQAAENAAAQEAEAEGNGHQPTADEVRTANILRNLQPTGTNGIFQILNISVRTARFSFRAWTTDASNPRRETIEVDAGPGGDIQLAVVRRMIELIRTYYQGDFNWESQRYGQVVLSARKQDTAQLEDFLMHEFFGVGVKNLAQ